jgi:hypothetical protein
MMLLRAQERPPAMKVTVNVDCTPEEARAFLGLPDVSPVHDKYIETVLKTMDGSTNLEQMEKMFRGLSPMGDAGVNLFRQLMDIGMANSGLGGSGSKSD